MEKLETILRAEDAARARVSGAHEEAGRIIKDAVARAAEIHAAAHAAAAADADARVAAIIEAATREAAELTAASARSLERTLDEAGSRIENAIGAVLSELAE